MRKLGETRPRAQPSQEEAEVVDEEPVEKPLQKLIQKIVGDRSGGAVGGDGNIRDKDTVAPGRDPNPPKDKKH